MTGIPKRRNRWLAALALGAISAAISAAYWAYRSPDHPPDIVQVWYAARVMLRGVNPYTVVGPGLEFDWPWKLYYPATAMAAILPLSIVPAVVAVVVFVGSSTSVLAYALTERGWHRLWIFCSIPYVIAVLAGQWTPILTAAFILPPFAMLAAAKPNFGVALFLSTGSAQVQRWVLAGGLMLGILSLLLFPEWPGEWLRVVWEGRHRAPISRTGGFLIVLALLRWRRPEARLIVLWACVPQIAYWYEIVPLMLVPLTQREVQTYSLLTSLGFLVERQFVVAFGEEDHARQLGVLVLVFAYLPAVWMVLRRPNEGAMVPWHLALERWVQRGWQVLRP